jgi:glycosyltransferase involved in cell wall biosynthesis
MDHATVAVIIPYYNGAKWIERAVKSVVSQTIPPDEFVVVNDGSTAAERAALVPLAEQYGFNIIDQRNGGQGCARNTGIAATTSQYISLLDQDDFYLPDHIKDLLATLPKEDPQLGFVYADLSEANEGGNIVHSDLLPRRAGTHPKTGNIPQLLRYDMFVMPSATLIRRTAFEAVGGFDPQFIGYEDDDLFLRMFQAEFTAYFLDKPVTVLCRHENSATKSIKMSRSRFRFLKKVMASLPDKNNNFYFRDCLMPRFGPLFASDVISAIDKHADRREELCKILNEYCNIVANRPEVSLLHKTNVRAVTYLLTKLSASLIKPLLPLYNYTKNSPRLKSIISRVL